MSSAVEGGAANRNVCIQVQHRRRWPRSGGRSEETSMSMASSSRELGRAGDCALRAPPLRRTRRRCRLPFEKDGGGSWGILVLWVQWLWHRRRLTSCAWAAGEISGDRGGEARGRVDGSCGPVPHGPPRGSGIQIGARSRTVRSFGNPSNSCAVCEAAAASKNCVATGMDGGGERDRLKDGVFDADQRDNLLILLRRAWKE